MAQIQNDPKEASKPEKVIQGMIQGRINKEMKEICLLDQVYVKAEDGKQSVAKYLDEVGKANGTTITLKKFVSRQVKVLKRKMKISQLKLQLR